MDELGPAITSSLVKICARATAVGVGVGHGGGAFHHWLRPLEIRLGFWCRWGCTALVNLIPRADGPHPLFIAQCDRGPSTIVGLGAPDQGVNLGILVERSIQHMHDQDTGHIMLVVEWSMSGPSAPPHPRP